ncbi:ATP-binding cassette domain-containing protein, partial [Pectobacterium polonicum]
MIELHHIRVSYPNGRDWRTVVHDASLSVKAGECFGLVGPSGCGKSSLLWTIAGLNPHWQGEMRLAHHAITPGTRFTGQLRRDVQMV